MEVMVRNVPEQMTERQLKNYFRDKLLNLDIKSYHCQKVGKKGATLTFVDKIKGNQFLMLHGQTTPGAQGFKHVREKLYAHSRPLNCSLSNKEPEEYLVRALKKEESDRYVTSQRKPIIVPGTLEPRKTDAQRAFDISTCECGQWTYDLGNLVFSSHWSSPGRGRIIFGSRCVMIKLHPPQPTSSSQQVEVPYDSIVSLTAGAQSGSLTFSLSESPKFYEEHQDPIELMLQKMMIGNGKGPQTYKRERLYALDDVHEKIVGGCLCYRIVLAKASDIAIVRGFKRHSEIPKIIYWEAPRVIHSPFYVQMTALNQALTSSKYDNMPFVVKFQIQRLAQNGYLPPTRCVEFMSVVQEQLIDRGAAIVAGGIRHMADQIPYAGPGAEASDFDLKNLGKFLKQSIKVIYQGDHYSSELAEQYDHIMLVHKATVTPTRIIFSGPEPEVKNRVLRKYSKFPNNFLSVSFLDENGEPLRFDRQTSSSVIYHKRFQRVLKSVINIAGYGYEFLGFSHSSLRSQSCWFMAPFTYEGSLFYAPGVIKDLGDFGHFRSPAKCAARIGQAFSQTLSSVLIPSSATHILPDIERNGHTFSDGVGTCSEAIMKRIWEGYSMGRAFKPTIFQIRFKGAKGVISLDSRLQGDALCLRKSMIKFEVNNMEAAAVEICGAANKPLSMYLNRPMIKILEDLGVPDDPFLELQRDAVERLRMTTTSPINASTFLERNFIGRAANLPWLIRKMSHIGFHFTRDDFLRNTLELAILIQLREIKHKSRILVEQGTTVYGIMDETGFLQESEIYCSIHKDTGPLLLTGSVVITRSPAMHPGDIQCVTAVDVPVDSPLRNLHNMVVFSSHGQRDLPSQLSGGDLDGDIYNVIYDQRLYPRKLSEPANYDAAPAVDIGRSVERSDMTDFFINFMENDTLGMISTLHQILADQSDLGTLDPDCIHLAGQASTAVDFSKTGIPVSVKAIQKYPRARPDFQAPGPHVLVEKEIALMEAEVPDLAEDGELDEVASYGPQSLLYYASDKILGKLYRDIDEHDFLSRIQARSRSRQPEARSLKDEVWQYVRNKTTLIQWRHHLEFADQVKENYEENLIDTMNHYSTHPTRPVTETEVFSGSILGKGGAQSSRQRESSVTMKEKYERDVTFIVRWITNGNIDPNGNGEEEALERSIACLYVGSQSPRLRQRYGELVSFFWIAAAVCLKEVEKLGVRG